MKRIIDILKKNGVAYDRHLRKYVLHYKERFNNGLLVSRIKVLTDEEVAREIEEGYEVTQTPTAIIGKKVGMTQYYPESMFPRNENIDEERVKEDMKRIYIGILQRLLVDDLYTDSPIFMWHGYNFETKRKETIGVVRIKDDSKIRPNLLRYEKDQTD